MFCPNCGKENKDQLDVCPVCGAPLRKASSESTPMENQPSAIKASNEAAPPPARQEATKGERLVAGYRVARLGDRLIAIILDTIMLMAVFAVCGSLVASRMGGQVTGGFSLHGMPAFITIGLVMLIGFLYFWFMEGIVGGTFGKRIMGIQVRGVDGNRCTLAQSLVRNLLRIVDGLAIYLVGFFIALFSKFRQRLGDHVAKTVVIEAPTNIVLRFIYVVLWLAIIALAVWGAYLIHSRIPTTI